MESALIVVDIQNDFCPGGVLAVPDGDAIIPAANSLLAAYPISVLTQDWHPLNHCSFASAKSLPPFSLDTSAEPPNVLWPDHCVAGTKGADFHPALQSWKARFIIRKGTRKELDSYSAFFENDGVTPTGLSGLLSSLGIQRVLVCGLATDYCVKATALDARRVGFKVVIVEDAIKGIDANPGDIDKAKTQMRDAGCVFAKTHELLAKI
ncbi:Pyrazinamidase/nicotinamidase [uncultured spirochete]|uniref:Nicotinamidase n=1 Tax=uncultured spirochete TaxID=156406 RepID=A0A3P3XMU6_9SPIR|nr:bifunctional nicotinamidase/pyrazinamidase [Rectinema subterraneum]SLM15754.1 Pyrazinamidase/nicotinamidase [uncultured spirochete]HBE46601.1 bifunctional nicotinamidase/pyrazinamidase [Spirochaetaceae bacterium]